MPDSFEDWVRKRQDVRTWNEDDLAVARLVWREAWKIAHQELDRVRKEKHESESERCALLNRSATQP